MPFNLLILSFEKLLGFCETGETQLQNKAQKDCSYQGEALNVSTAF